MKFIKLTKIVKAKVEFDKTITKTFCPIYVNPDHILFFNPDAFGAKDKGAEMLDFTEVWMCNQCIRVTETPDEIINIIRDFKRREHNRNNF